MRLVRNGKFPSRSCLRAAVRSCTRVSSDHLTPEIRLHLVTRESPLWKARPEESPFTDPYWAFYWAGGQALARYILDNKSFFQNKNIIDIGSGCGACSIAADYSNARMIIANDLDPVACEVISMNCLMNNASKVHINSCNLINKKLPSETDLLLIGDMFYDPEFGEVLFDWLLKCKAEGLQVLIGDPGRYGLDKFKIQKMSLLKEYSLMPQTVLENNGFKSSYVWEL